MEGGESVLDTLSDEESIEGAEDIRMLDVEEGELTEMLSKAELVESSNVGLGQVNQESGPSNLRQKKKRKKNKRKKRNGSGPNVTDVNRFVLDTCKRLRERKSYLVWTAVGCLGVSALSDLVKEVDAIQACGGQTTSDGRRSRSGGGILWNIIKSRDPNAYKEIMRKGKEFEKQFKQQFRSNQEPTAQQTNDCTDKATLEKDQIKSCPSDGLDHSSYNQSQTEHLRSGKKRTSVHNRIRVPVSYDDLLTGEGTNDEQKHLDF